MKIYAEVCHVPYLYNLAIAFPEHEFLATNWSELRPIPPNVLFVDPNAYYGKSVDVVIDSLPHFQNFERDADRKIKLLHMERGANSSNDDEFIAECVKRSDALVSVSEHKLWTYMEAALSPTSVAIPFGVPALPIADPVPGLVGNVHMYMNAQQETVWKHVLRDFPGALLIGKGNSYPAFAPKCYEDFNERFSQLDVFVNTVTGNSVGLTVVEAMMRGIPVVTGMNQDIPKEMIDGWNCVILRGHTADCLEELTAAIRRLIDDRERRERIAYAARKTAQRIFGLDAFRHRWNCVFHNLFNNRLNEMP